jgi:Pyridoxamine 5'-phosphate oxidase
VTQHQDRPELGEQRVERDTNSQDRITDRDQILNAQRVQHPRRSGRNVGVAVGAGAPRCEQELLASHCLGGGSSSCDARWGVWLTDDDQFWFSCATTARKARNLSENPQCAVTVDDTVECVSVEGVARRIDPEVDAAGFSRMVTAYLAKYFLDVSEHADTEAFLRSNAIFAVTPERAFGVIERADEFPQRATRWAW